MPSPADAVSLPSLRLMACTSPYSIAVELSDAQSLAVLWRISPNIR